MTDHNGRSTGRKAKINDDDNVMVITSPLPRTIRNGLVQIWRNSQAMMRFCHGSLIMLATGQSGNPRLFRKIML